MPHYLLGKALKVVCTDPLIPAIYLMTGALYRTVSPISWDNPSRVNYVQDCGLLHATVSLLASSTVLQDDNNLRLIKNWEQAMRTHLSCVAG